MPFTFFVHQDIKTINHNKCLTNLLPYSFVMVYTIKQWRWQPFWRRHKSLGELTKSSSEDFCHKYHNKRLLQPLHHLPSSQAVGEKQLQNKKFKKNRISSRMWEISNHHKVCISGVTPCKSCVSVFLPFALCKRIQDSLGFLIPRCGLQIFQLGLCQWNFESGL